jgi:hypothetical protein
MHKFGKEMKTIIIIILLLSAGMTVAQELNLGLEIGSGPKSKNSTIFSLGPRIEYRLKGSIISLNTGVLYLFTKDVSILTFPANIKFIIGNKFRICPTVGGFIRSNKNHGWTLGSFYCALRSITYNVPRVKCVPNFIL